MATVRKNIVLNIINTVSGIVFPIITFPYAARVLLPQGLGAFNFMYGIVENIILLTSFGIPLYAVKEIARLRTDLRRRNQTTAELLTLSATLCLGGYIAVWLLGAYAPELRQHSATFYVISCGIFFNAIGANWFYQGIEEFGYITLRIILLRILAAAGLFIFVRTPDDLLIYAVVMIGTGAAGNLINFIHLRSFIPVSSVAWRNLEFRRYFRPLSHAFALSVILVLYQLLNTVMLGFMTAETQVGYYSAANRIIQIVITCITCAGAVLLPRCSALVSEGRTEEFKAMAGLSLRYTIAFALPAMAGILILAAPINLIFCGEAFLPSEAILRILAPVVLILGISNILSIQILYPLGKIRLIIMASAAGTLLNIILNLLFIPRLQADGAALALLAAEVTILAVQICAGRKHIPVEWRSVRCRNYIVSSLVMAGFLTLTAPLVEHPLPRLIYGVISGAAVYLLLLALLRDSLVEPVLHYLGARKK